MKLFFPFAIGIFFFASCDSNDGKRSEPVQETFVPEVILIDDAYPQLSADVLPVLEGLKICTLSDTVPNLPPCSNEFFRVFKYMPEKDYRSGFIVEMIPGLFNSPVHQIVVIRENNGKHQIVNQYFGKLLEMRTNYSGFSDLLIGYDDPDIGLVSIKHVWESKKYQPVDVEEINNHFVKPEMKDSINAIFIPAFNAGH